MPSTSLHLPVSPVKLGPFTTHNIPSAFCRSIKNFPSMNLLCTSFPCSGRDWEMSEGLSYPQPRASFSDTLTVQCFHQEGSHICVQGLGGTSGALIQKSKCWKCKTLEQEALLQATLRNRSVIFKLKQESPRVSPTMLQVMVRALKNWRWNRKVFTK